MAPSRAERPHACDHVLLVGTGDARLAAELRARVSRIPGREPAGHPRRRRARFEVLVAASPAEVRRRCTPAVSVAAIDLAIRAATGLDLIRTLRDARPELAILAFGRSAAPSDAIAAVMAGADFFHACTGEACAGLERALERALDRRRLLTVVERSEAQMEDARGKLAQLSGELANAVPGFRPLHARDDVLPFREAARRYLLAAAQLFEGDARGLSAALGVSYFALRRLLARYEVPYPGARSRKQGTRRP